MRLTQIKLSGFKSFVDPTVITTPSQLVGVVGPNGCGKSNIIDAVRWVLGESRASELRGGSMQDVIFNGTKQRKAAARASVELHFDNAQGRVGGQWGAYTDIAVRRELSREGQSGYFINGQQVRRRDVYDIFMGTGLGARGYAIIGQGMINRLIEARPEELRVYLEEAAGVSRYKERRKETESRLRDTTENLQRLDDVLIELAQHLERLQAQAQIAQQYKALQAEGEKKQHALWWHREQNARTEQKQQFLAIEQTQTALEKAVADVRSAETRLEHLRQSHLEQTDTVQRAQSVLHQHNAQLSRLEAEIKHATTAQTRIEKRQQQLHSQQTEWQQLRLDSAAELEQKQQAVEHAHQQLEELAERVLELEDRLLPAQDQHQAQQHHYEQLKNQKQQAQQQQALAQQRHEQAQLQQTQLLQTQQRLDQELAALQHSQPVELQQVQTQWHQAQQEQQQLKQHQEQVELQLHQAQTASVQAQQQLQHIERSYAQVQAQLQAAQQIQAQVQQHEQLDQWLTEQQLAQQPRLWQLLTVDEGWEKAVESVLADRLQAITTHQLTTAAATQQPPPASVWLVEPAPVVPIAETGPLVPLSQYVRSTTAQWADFIQQSLQFFYAASTMQQALALQAQLDVHTCIVSPEGHQVYAHQIKWYAATTEQSGMLARQQHIEQYSQQVAQLQTQVEQAQQQLAQAEQEQHQLQERYSQLQQRHQLQIQHTHDLQLKQQQLAQQQQYQLTRLQQLQHELTELNAQQLQWQELAEQALSQQEQQQAVAEELDIQVQQAEAQLTELNHQLRFMQDQLRDLEQQRQRVQYNEALHQARISELERSQNQAHDLSLRTQAELEGLIAVAQTTDLDELRAQLQEQLEQRVLAEDQLHQEQQVLAQLNEQLQNLQQNRHQHQDGIEPLRQKLMELQLAEQAARLRIEQYATQLNEQQVDRQALAAYVQQQEDSWQKVAWLQSELQRINKAVNELGAVNLAALEELQTAQQRQQYLESQHADLSQAIQTLEEAIRKIDRETRALLQSTFNQVNEHFGQLFPQLFGGGEAKLIMTGEEILDAGVQVMAQPPGKRNSSIQLLSGGEKALTATALVFAFFKLNPAPFCLLDEVDAPLDDSNTERYAQLVQSMSDQTQFLFISHNKIAMQMAKQLIGVTMQEQGVSRIVAVDMAAAVSMT